MDSESESLVHIIDAGTQIAPVRSLAPARRVGYATTARRHEVDCTSSGTDATRVR
jgi:hypothetical protein